MAEPVGGDAGIFGLSAGLRTRHPKGVRTTVSVSISALDAALPERSHRTSSALAHHACTSVL